MRLLRLPRTPPFQYHTRSKGLSSELADYHGHRLRVLAELFGCDLKPTDSDDAQAAGHPHDWEAARDRAQVVSIARACLRKHTTSAWPFGFYMEGGPGPLEQRLLDRQGARMSRALALVQRRLRETFADCLRALYPGIERRKVPVAALVERGVAAEGPDPDEFW